MYRASALALLQSDFTCNEYCFGLKEELKAERPHESGRTANDYY